MSDDSARVGRTIGKALAEAHAAGARGGGRRGGGDRRGGRGGGEDRCRVRKPPRRCFHCGSEDHRSRDCPCKGGPPLRTEAPAQQDASPPREAPPVFVQRLALPRPPPPVRPSTPPTTTQTPAQEADPVRQAYIMPVPGPEFLPLPGPPPQLTRPPMRMGHLMFWHTLFCRWYYFNYIDGSYEWSNENR
ncbi:uncharacterized protein FIESC28_08875 [Fusarium coffeatum]|uniref:CCHC-type domain-containing protein n=1 Tax=Fusarium coffeatum TaxID=231269 RepID=A0A366R552_9HYPO|nr:uncharacterized protein FIESC28_08875 [Fusarium coffeatum]RBR11648.1 hypothetical protein FIESC28_08875 [Fusarium coffeatum]